MLSDALIPCFGGGLRYGPLVGKGYITGISGFQVRGPYQGPMVWIVDALYDPYVKGLLAPCVSFACF